MFRQPLLPLLFLTCLLGGANAQPADVELNGKVIEIKDGKRTPMAGIKVSAAGIHFDFTDRDGSFTLLLPANLPEITLTLEETSLQFISPGGGKVILPPANFLLVRVCGEENRRLLAQVKKLDGQIRKLAQGKKLAEKQWQLMRETMLDTIEIFEESIRQQSILLENANTENQELLELIRKLEGQNDSLLQLRMQENLDRFMLENRQRAFASISAGLNNYLSRLKDVHRNFHVVGDYEFPEAKARFDKIIKSYSAARNVVDTLQTSHVHDVTLFWEDENLAQELTSVYQFLLVVVHENEVWTPYFETVEPRLREQLFGKARKSAQAMQERLAPLIRELESRSNNIQKELQKGLNVR